jgi:hypothetical protein
MLFETELDLGISNQPGKWVNTKKIKYDKGIDALEAYANTKCPASQLVDALTDEELDKEIEQMRKNYQDETWLEENLYPFL